MLLPAEAGVEGRTRGLPAAGKGAEMGRDAKRAFSSLGPEKLLVWQSEASC